MCKGEIRLPARGLIVLGNIRCWFIRKNDNLFVLRTYLQL